MHPQTHSYFQPILQNCLFSPRIFALTVCLLFALFLFLHFLFIYHQVNSIFSKLLNTLIILLFVMYYTSYLISVMNFILHIMLCSLQVFYLNKCFTLYLILLSVIYYSLIFYVFYHSVQDVSIKTNLTGLDKMTYSTGRFRAEQSKSTDYIC